MRLSVQVTGDFGQIVAAQVDRLSDGLKAAVQGVAQNAQRKLRGQVQAAGLGEGLAKAWRTEIYPQGKRTLRPAGLVYSKSAILHEAFIEGATVLPRRGRYLVLPLAGAIARGFGTTDRNRKGGAVPGGMKRRASRLDDAAEALRADIVSVAEHRKRQAIGPRRDRAPRARLVLFPSKRRPGALLAVLFPAGSAKGEAMFLLVRAVRVPKLLNLASVEAEAAAELRSAAAGAVA